MKTRQGFVQFARRETRKHPRKHAELPGRLESLRWRICDVDGNGVGNKRVEAKTGAANLHHLLPLCRGHRSGKNGFRIVQGQVAAYLIYVFRDELRLGKYVLGYLLQNKIASLAANQPGTVDQSAAVRGDPDVLIETIGSQYLIQHEIEVYTLQT